MEANSLSDTSPDHWRPTRQLLILVGGKGTRLGTLTQNTPKPLMQIDENTVFLDHLIANFARQGFDDILLLAGHMAEQVSDRYDKRQILGASIRIVNEQQPAGTAGALAHASALLQDTFLLANGDTLFDVNVRHLEPVLAANSEAEGVIALRHVENAGRYGAVDIADGHVIAFREKDSHSTSGGLINAGIGLFRKSILSRITEIPSSLELDVYPRMVEENYLLGQEFSGYFIDIGLPETLEQARIDIPKLQKRPALFLDRDGVINEDRGYTFRVGDLKLIDGAIELIRLANDFGAFVIVVTNQAGVARGFYELSDVERFHREIENVLIRNGAFIDAFYVCPFHSEAIVPEYCHPDHPNRKPNPGMLIQALTDWPIDAAKSIMIGDKESDIIAAERAGIKALLFKGSSLADLRDFVSKQIARQ
ncbi:HAD-IIIA family hydrolase [Rhizobium lusitanum]|uniref:D,D-heptose 1,7-bisphosphate phosphatase n=1 Tax=Rhizobium lusitanum TaxID=293958 RepID=A0A7X0MF39_9HYPH|nr:HAD-IIIA family hydrolase [Rhizobium lusitanum]MBB6486715.1 D-glycero-D-manno-heptose 1,7-bisphosphate phosphatase [Rhizobium lusitanum]